MWGLCGDCTGLYGDCTGFCIRIGLFCGVLVSLWGWCVIVFCVFFVLFVCCFFYCVFLFLLFVDFVFCNCVVGLLWCLGLFGFLFVRYVVWCVGLVVWIWILSSLHLVSRPP